MTAQQLKDFIVATLLATRSISQEISVFNAVIDFITQSVTTGIPSWTALLDFNADGTGDGAFTTHPDDNGNLRFWNSKGAGNIGHEPPTDPDINEDAFWIEVSPSSGSAIKEWAEGIYGAGLVITYWNGELYLLTAATRPYYSGTQPSADTANWMAIIKGVLGTSTWKQVAKVSTTAALPSYTALTLNGIENCLRATANGPFANVDGQVMNVGDTILVRHEDNWQLNKVYTLTTKGTTAVPPFISGAPWVLTPREDMRYSGTGDLYINGIVKIELGAQHGGKIYSNKKDGSTGSTATWAEFPHVLRSYFQASPTLVVGDVLKHDLTKVSSAADKPYAVIVDIYNSGSYYTPQISGLTEAVPITGSPAVGDYIYVSPSGALTTTESDWIFGVYQSGGVLIDIKQRTGTGKPITEVYANIAAMLADQAGQDEGYWYAVTDASTDPSVDTGWAIYEYLGTTNGDLTDYFKRQEQESIDVVIADATPSVKGIAKLYNALGSNTDGAITQDAATQAINGKWGLSGTSTLLAAVTIAGAFNLGFTNNQVGFGIAPGSIGAGAKVEIDSGGLTFALRSLSGGALFQSNIIAGIGNETNSVYLRNSTAAAAGVQQGSPSFVQEGQGWVTTGGVSQSVKFASYVTPVQGVSSSGVLSWAVSLNSSAYTQVMSITSGGSLTISSLTTVTAGSHTLTLNSTSQSPVTLLSLGGASRVNTSGVYDILNGTIAFTPTSGNAIFNYHTYSGTLQQTGGANGAVTIYNSKPIVAVSGLSNLTGYDWNPTLTGSVSGTHLAWRNTSGQLLFGGTTITAGSILADFQSATQGIVVPRPTLIANIATPVNAMVAYDTTVGRFNFREAGVWSKYVREIDFSADGNYEVKHFNRALSAGQSNVTFETNLVLGSEVNNGESVTCVVYITGKRDSNNTGFGGVYIATWTKASGTLNFVAESGASLLNDMAATVTVSTLDSSGDIRISLTNNITANCTWSWVAYITINKP